MIQDNDYTSVYNNFVALKFNVMSREQKPNISLHLLKAGNFDFQSYEWAVVSQLLRVNEAADIIYREVPRLPLFNKLNELGLAVLYDPKNKRMYLSGSSINNYYEKVMGGKFEVERSYFQKRSEDKL